ncbi:hypothetical protein BC826DRAFT_1108462 [Russula brevipes]|nr:hypothetical protein BC826DRAFT_1108462 [Russula brevipes]
MIAQQWHRFSQLFSTLPQVEQRAPPPAPQTANTNPHQCPRCPRQQQQQRAHNLSHKRTTTSASPSRASSNSATDALQIRRALQDALAQSFGTTLSHAYLDVLWVEDVDASSGTGREPSASDAAKVIAAIAVANGGTLRLSAIKESPFLPSVSVSGGGSRTIF